MLYCCCISVLQNPFIFPCHCVSTCDSVAKDINTWKIKQMDKTFLYIYHSSSKEHPYQMDLFLTNKLLRKIVYNLELLFSLMLMGETVIIVHGGMFEFMALFTTFFVQLSSQVSHSLVSDTVDTFVLMYNPTVSASSINKLIN